MNKEKDSKKEVNLLDVVLVLAKNKWFITKMVFSITLIALILSLVWPKTYMSTAQFLPPVQQNSLGGGLDGMLGGMLPMQTSSDKLGAEAILVVLRSRNLREKVINEFDFREVYSSNIMEELLRKLDANTQLEEVREGGFGFNPVVALELSFIDEDPERAQAVTAFYISQLDSVVKNLNQLNADESYNMVKQRYEKNLTDITKAEEELKQFQETYGILEVESQSKAIVETLADLRSSAIEMELKINLLEQTVNPSNSELVNLKRSKQEVDRKYNEMVNHSNSAPGVNIFHSLQDMPDLSLQYMRKYREVIIQNSIQEVVLPQYEQQLMLRNDSSRNIQIVDEASMPTYKHTPKRAIIVLAGLLFSLFLSFVIVFIKETYRSGKKENSEGYSKLNAIMSALKSKRDQV
ncbi:MAG: GNVR domain-containing protein [Balneolales bacterium]